MPRHHSVPFKTRAHYSPFQLLQLFSFSGFDTRPAQQISQAPFLFPLRQHLERFLRIALGVVRPVAACGKELSNQAVPHPSMPFQLDFLLEGMRIAFFIQRGFLSAIPFLGGLFSFLRSFGLVSLRRSWVPLAWLRISWIEITCLALGYLRLIASRNGLITGRESRISFGFASFL